MFKNRYRFICLFFYCALISSCSEKNNEMKLSETFSTETTKFIEAVVEKNFDKANEQLLKGANINEIGLNGITPLLWVYTDSNDAHKLIEYMLLNGANPSYRDEQGFSALYLATGGDRKEILEVLLKYGGDPNLEAPEKLGGAFRRTMLMVAISNFREEYFDLLLDHGADVNWNIEGNKGSLNIIQSTINVGHFDWTLFFLKKGFKGNLQEVAVSAHVRKVSDDMKPYKQDVFTYLETKGVNIQQAIANFEARGVVLNE